MWIIDGFAPLTEKERRKLKQRAKVWVSAFTSDHQRGFAANAMRSFLFECFREPRSPPPPCKPAVPDTATGREMAAELTNAERLARAVLLFHAGGAWSEDRHMTWIALTGEAECTTRTLCDFARRIKRQEEGG